VADIVPPRRLAVCDASRNGRADGCCSFRRVGEPADPARHTNSCAQCPSLHCPTPRRYAVRGRGCGGHRALDSMPRSGKTLGSSRPSARGRTVGQTVANTRPGRTGDLAAFSCCGGRRWSISVWETPASRTAPSSSTTTLRASATPEIAAVHALPIHAALRSTARGRLCVQHGCNPALPAAWGLGHRVPV